MSQKDFNRRMPGIYCHMKGLYMFYTRNIPGIYYLHGIFHWYTPGIHLLYDIFIAYTRYMLCIWQVYTWWLVLCRWKFRPHAARATSNNITRPCHYYDSFRFTTFAHFTFGHLSVHCPFRQKERRKTPFFARIAHKAFHLGQYRWPIRYKGRDSASWGGRKGPNIRPGATTVVAL